MEPDIAAGYFTYLMNIDVGKLTYLRATKSYYLLQSATAKQQQQHQSNH